MLHGGHHLFAENFAPPSPGEKSDRLSTEGPAPHRSPAKKPCSGPNCSGHPGHFPAVPVVVSSQATEHWLWLIAAPLVPEAGNGTILRDRSVDRPIDRSFRIEHPPRSA
jgi:hypothetical protein